MLPWMALAVAAAQEPVGVPGQGVAGEEGPTQAWVNPSLLGHDPDARLAVVVHQPLEMGATPRSVAVTGGARGLFGGLQWERVDGADRVRIDAGAGVELGKHLAIGGALHGRIAADQSRIDLDLGASYRPLPWLGLGAATYHLGAPTQEGAPPPAIRVGAALRPFGRKVVFGLDYAHDFGLAPRDVGILSLRVRPTSGLFVRAEASTDARLGFGIEAFFGGIGGGVGVVGTVPSQAALGEPASVVLWAGTDEPEERLVPSRSIPELVPGVRTTGMGTARVEASPPAELDLAPAWLEHGGRRGTQRLVVRFGLSDLNRSRWLDVAASIQRAREAGVEVTAYLDGDVDAWAFAAASQANRVVAHPASTLRLSPPHDERVWLGRLSDVLGLDVDTVRSGAAKDAGDGWTRSAPTQASRDARVAWLDKQHALLVTSLASGRRCATDRAASWLAQGPWTASAALGSGLIDAVAWSDQLPELLQGTDARTTPIRGPLPRRRWIGQSAWEDPVTIGLLPIHGPLRDRGLDAPTALLQALERARRDPAMRAVVLDIDSPGGSPWAADELARAVARLRASGKPVVAYLGDHATSGALRIAIEADRVIASPATETGSVGAYAQHIALGDALRRLGADVQELQPTGVTGAAGWGRTWDPGEAARQQAVVDETARRFMQALSSRRSLTPHAEDILADGRVLAAETALTLGLVDAVGTRFDAILAAQAAATPSRRDTPGKNLEVHWLLPQAGDRQRGPGQRGRATPPPTAPTHDLGWLEAVLLPLLAPDGPPP
jgi:protease-4